MWKLIKSKATRHIQALATLSVAVGSGTLLSWARIYHNVVPLSRASESDKRLTVLVLAASTLAVLSVALFTSLRRPSRTLPASWPLFECVVLLLVVVYMRSLNWADEVFPLFYIAFAWSFATTLTKLVRSLSQRFWLKATASVIISIVSGLLALST
jgi:hypothetical protein